MCGIIGYTGSENVKDVLLDALELLEYRGYDSAGIAVKDETSHVTNVYKCAGRVSDLRAICDSKKILSACGIGHTRWATHGGVTDQNAHPHQQGKVTLVHNGIIENYRELIADYDLQEILHSETDSEVVVHMMDYYYKKEKNLQKALERVITRIEGSYALCIVSTEHPDEVVVAKKASPLVIGRTEDASVAASDIPALLAYTKDVYFLDDLEMAVLKKDSITFYNKDGKEITKEMTTIPYDMEAAQKNGFDTYMLKEINEQPHVIQETLRGRIFEHSIVLDELKDVDFNKFNKVYYVACGTAYHAGLCGASILERATRLPVLTQVASEFRYNDPIIDEKTLCIFVSQSGETADTLAALKLANEKGCTTIAVTNVLGSTISREAQHTLYTCAGPEIAVASTKAYTTQLVLLTLIALYIADKRGDTVDTDLMEQLNNLPEYVSKLIDDEAIFENYAKTLKDKHDCYFIGRSLDYASVLEGALKLKEVSYVHADAYIAGELKHGPIALIEPGTVVIAVATQPHVAAKTISNIQETIARGAEVILFTVEGQEVSGVENIYYLPNINPLLQSVLVAIPLQLIAYHTACIKGCDVDKPRNLAKSVTVE